MFQRLRKMSIWPIDVYRFFLYPLEYSQKSPGWYFYEMFELPSHKNTQKIYNAYLLYGMASWRRFYFICTELDNLPGSIIWASIVYARCVVARYTYSDFKLTDEGYKAGCTLLCMQCPRCNLPVLPCTALLLAGSLVTCVGWSVVPCL